MVTFNFSFTSDAADDIFSLSPIAGTVTGTLELTDNTSGQQPTSLIITSAPAGLGVDIIGTDIITNAPGFLSLTGGIDVSGGVITDADLFVDFDDSDGDILQLFFDVDSGFAITDINGLANFGPSGGSGDDIGVTGNTNGFDAGDFTPVVPNTAPTITSAATASVAENQTSAIDVESTDDTDSEGSGLTYSLTGGADAALFSIDADSGVVTFNAAPDFEAPSDANGDNDFEFLVTVTDSAGLTDVQDITVSVTDEVENTAPTITSAATATVPENQTSAIDVESSDDTDSEGSGLTYSLTGGADAALFSIDADNGVVTFNAAPDFEARLMQISLQA